MGRSRVSKGNDDELCGERGLEEEEEAEGGFAVSVVGFVDAESSIAWLGSGDKWFWLNGFVPGAVADRGGGWMISSGRIVLAGETLPSAL